MDKPNSPKSNYEEVKIKKETQETLKHADALYEHVKDKASEMYEEGKKTVCEAHEHIREHKDELIKHVREKPLSSLLIAAGVGFILSALLRK